MWFNAFLIGCFWCISAVLTGEWTHWSEWSSCSRSCGGGISIQHRRCIKTSASVSETNRHCDGEAVQHRVCELQSCLEGETEPKSEICSSLTDVVLNGTTYRWIHALEQTGNCSVACSPSSSHGTLEDQVVYRIQPDGTRCFRSSSSSSSESGMGFCFSGKCQTVGCDKIFGSSLQLDHCGVCGGDNSTCLTQKKPRLHQQPPSSSLSSSSSYRWRETGYTACSVSCGIGEEQVIFSCRNLSNDETVPDHFCRLSEDVGEKPKRTRLCRGTDCDDNRAIWIADEWQECSRSCDGGLSTRFVYCVIEQNDGTFERTTDTLCRFQKKPVTEKQCNEFECPKWFAGQWSHCSASCGSGIQQRAVVCKRTDSVDCVASEKPTTKRSCYSRLMCPHQPANPDSTDTDFDPDAFHGLDSLENIGPWTSFDISQGQLSDLERGNEVAEGVDSKPTDGNQRSAQTKQPFYSEKTSEFPLHTVNSKSTVERQPTVKFHATVEPQQTVKLQTTLERQSTVKLQSTAERQSTVKLLPTVEPHSTVKLLPTVERRMTVKLQPTVESEREAEPGEAEEEEQHTTEPEHDVEPYQPPVGYGEDNSSTTDDDIDSEFDGWNPGNGDEDDQRISDEYDPRNTGIDGDEESEDDRMRTDGIYRSGPAVENKKATTVPSFVVSPWGHCSRTCGTGVRTRRVVCKVLLEPAKVIQELPDLKCEGPKPPDTEYCILKDCATDTSPRVFQWIITGYGQCSKTCAGGTQEGEYHCVKIPEYNKVDRIRCLRQTPPQRVKRPCNMHDCPPRWNPLPYGQCSASCGGGQQYRQLQCVRDQRDQKMAVVSDTLCIATPLPTAAPCNLIPCPAKWTIDSWSECSVTCGPGLQVRNVKCEQKLTSQETIAVDEVACWQQMNKPETERPCEAGKCHARTRASMSAAIRSESYQFIQVKPMTNVPLLVGVNASVITGSAIVIQCPVSKQASRLNLTWKYNDKFIDFKKRRRLRVDKHGSIRIRNSRSSDRGVYSCVVGRDSANATIRFHAIEDSLRQLRTRQRFLEEEEGGELPFDEDVMVRFASELKKLFTRKRKATYSGHFLVDQMPPDIVPLHYVPLAWAACSAECGGAGVQSRDVVCSVMGDDFILDVDDGFCNDRRQLKPFSDRDCGFGKCPHWEPGPWSECADDNCSAVGTGHRRRLLECVSANGQKIEAQRCNGQPKPADQEECPHNNCVAVWKTSNWTRCSLTCGGKGVKTRTSRCVWRSTKKQAGTLCSILQKPSSIKSCFTPLCPEASNCRDESKYCQIIPELQMCRYPQYRQECCHSCSQVRPTSTQSHASSSYSVRQSAP